MDCVPSARRRELRRFNAAAHERASFHRAVVAFFTCDHEDSGRRRLGRYYEARNYRLELGVRESSYDAEDAAFQKRKKAEPTLTFAQYQMQRVLKTIDEGKPHHSLGRNLVGRTGGNVEFWEASEKQGTHYVQLMSLKPWHKVVEYGCGSLRLGGYLMRYLEPGHYFGLDVISGFYDVGLELVGPELVQSRRPQLRVIDETSLQEAESFGADFVVSNAVCVHVHPDELGSYFANLSRLAHKRGAKLILNVVIAARPLRYRYSSWAWPLDLFREAMPGLTLIKIHGGKFSREEDGGPIGFATLEFEREPTLWSRAQAHVRPFFRRCARIAGRSWSAARNASFRPRE